MSGELAVDAAGVATSVGALVVPLAAAAVIGYGLFRASIDADAARSAAVAGVVARADAKMVASGYARVLTGGRGGVDQGSAEAERQISSIMAKTHASRDEVVAQIKSAQGGYATIYEQALGRLKDYLYAESVRRFEDSHHADFGVVETMGETWGMRGIFRNTLRLVLYAD